MKRISAGVTLLSLLLITLAALVISTSCITVEPPSPGQQQSPASRSQGEASHPVTILAPLPDDRYVENEPVKFAASVVDGSHVSWNSSRDGFLGTGLQITARLSAGSHQITAASDQNKAYVQARVYRDLWSLYQSSPTQGEVNRIQNDFFVNWLDGNTADEKWGSYNSFYFDQKSPDPSKMTALSRLEILRRQQFSQPLPFTSSKTAYENLKTFVKRMNLRLDCGINTAGGNQVNLNRAFSVWDSRISGNLEKPAACKTPLSLPITLNNYISPLYLLLHEARHCEAGEPGHVTCNGNDNMDSSLNGGSGHARAALYLMWVYKYSLYDPQLIRDEAKLIARDILKSRFCSTPQHSNPAVQAVVNELMGQ